MKLSNVKEVGYYAEESDLDRILIYEVFKNADKKWLEEYPEQELIVDEWTYKFTDNDGRKYYTMRRADAYSVSHAKPISVVKIEDAQYTTNPREQDIGDKLSVPEMREDKPSYKELFLEKSKKEEVFKKIAYDLSKLIQDIMKVIEKQKRINICTFPDLDLTMNTKAIMGQCNEGYTEILNKISEGVSEAVKEFEKCTEKELNIIKK